MRYVFAGDRDISVWVLQYLVERRELPVALLIPDPLRATHAPVLRSLCSHLPDELVLMGREFREESGVDTLRRLDVDLILSVHFPYIVPASVLQIPAIGVLNLHPAYLPYNRGWHTPSWAILEGTPIGATLHFMDEGVDTGDIVHQRQLVIRPGDTAHSLYRRLKQLELEVFREAWPDIVAGRSPRIPQNLAEGTTHRRVDLFHPDIQRIDLNKATTAFDLLRRLRALTTNDVAEAAYFDVDGIRYRVQVHITEEA